MSILLLILIRTLVNGNEYEIINNLPQVITFVLENVLAGVIEVLIGELLKYLKEKNK